MVIHHDVIFVLTFLFHEARVSKCMMSTWDWRFHVWWHLSWYNFRTFPFIVIFFNLSHLKLFLYSYMPSRIFL